LKIEKFAEKNILKKMRNLRKKIGKKSGFSLLEILVTIVISGILLAAAAGNFAYFLRAEQKINLQRELQKQVFFAMSRLNDAVRGCEIDFASFSPEKINFKKNSVEKIFEKTDENHIFPENFLLENQPLFSKKFRVEKINFVISPKKDPRENWANPQFQPKVEIFLHARSREIPEISTAVRTVISSRIY